MVRTIEISVARAFCFERDLGNANQFFFSEFLDRKPTRFANVNDDDKPDPEAVLPRLCGISPGRLFINTPSRHRDRPHERQAVTLRSWRDPRCIGGKPAARKLERRRPVK